MCSYDRRRIKDEMKDQIKEIIKAKREELEAFGKQLQKELENNCDGQCDLCESIKFLNCLDPRPKKNKEEFKLHG